MEQESGIAWALGCLGDRVWGGTGAVGLAGVWGSPGGLWSLIPSGDGLSVGMC